MEIHKSLFVVLIIQCLFVVQYVRPDCGCNKLKRQAEGQERPTEQVLFPDGKSEDHEPKPERLVDLVEHSKKYEKMSLIPGGEYIIGTDEPIFAKDRESPARTVSVDEFYLDQYEVSNGQFREFVDQTGYTTEAETFGDSFVFQQLLAEEVRKQYEDFRVAAAPWWYKSRLRTPNQNQSLQARSKLNRQNPFPLRFRKKKKKKKKNDDKLPEYQFIEEEVQEPGLQELALAMSAEENLKALDDMLNKTRFHGAIELKLKSYMTTFPRIKPLPVSDSVVEIDLANPDEDTWILQCPANVDLHSELLNKKINLSAPSSKIKNCSIPLTAIVKPNTGEQAVGLMCGSRIKSFVPAGLIRIRETPTLPDEMEMEENANTIEIPFPDDIRQRHPLLGYDFEESTVMPDPVKERLSLARKRAEQFYTTPVPVVAPSGGTVKKSKSKSKQIKQEPETVTIKTEPPSDVEDEFVSPTKSAKKRKAADTSTVPAPRKMIKLETLSQEDAPEHTQVGKKPTTIKREDVEDDISWLLNI
ncbi:AGAP013122-PA-like protein [Anopheles sinensis]|uniref:AGAP013122-PA-like protein n=1 Tax=Anopheles sinensis TaxID=74873 RepID=A0A084WQ90_ANOSI|nr:AGAP013122-PA-like protein [Anopheles sinensis]